MNINKIILTLLILLFSTPLFSDPIITIEQEKSQNHGIGVSVPINTNLRHIFGDGEIVSITDTGSNFGTSITVVSKMNYSFKGVMLEDKIFVIYSNIKDTSKQVGDIVVAGEVIAMTGGNGSLLHPDTTDIYVYIYTEKHSPMMNQYTGNQYIEQNEIYWWDPSFAFSN